MHISDEGRLIPLDFWDFHFTGISVRMRELPFSLAFLGFSLSAAFLNGLTCMIGLGLNGDSDDVPGCGVRSSASCGSV